MRTLRKRIVANRASRSRVGSGRDLDVCASLVWAGFLSTLQVERLHFPSRRRAQRRLRALLDHGLVRAHLQGGALERENVYVPTALAIDRLVERGDFGSERPVPPRLPAPQKLAHALAIRDVFVSAVLVERTSASDLEVRFDSDLTRDPRFAPHRLIPDLCLGVGGLVRLVVEVDRSTETTSTIRTKLERWRSVATEQPVLELVFVVGTDARAATVLRLAAEAGVALEAVVVSQISAWLAAKWPREVAAPPDVTERPAEHAVRGLFRGVSR